VTSGILLQQSVLRPYISLGFGTRKRTMSTEPDIDELPPAAQRALEEAAQRRASKEALPLPAEIGGRDGPEPVRFGDWERKGIAVDF
jgi:hypothetical protein